MRLIVASCLLLVSCAHKQVDVPTNKMLRVIQKDDVPLETKKLKVCLAPNGPESDTLECITWEHFLSAMQSAAIDRAPAEEECPAGTTCI